MFKPLGFVMACYSLSLAAVKREIKIPHAVNDYTLCATGRSAVVAVMLGVADTGASLAAVRILALLLKRGYWTQPDALRVPELNSAELARLIGIAGAGGFTSVAEALDAPARAATAARAAQAAREGCTCGTRYALAA